MDQQIVHLKSELKEEIREVKEDINEIKKDMKVLIEMRYRFLGGVRVLSALITVVGFLIGILITIIKK